MEQLQIQDGVLISYTGREEIVTVPEGIHTIGEGAFKACVSLRKVELKEGVCHIGAYAFKGCRRLEEIELPSSVTEIGSYAFHRCHALRKVVLPPSVKRLRDCVFLYCDSLEEVVMPGVKRLGKQVFVNDVLLERLTVSTELSVADICDVFTGCGMIREISFENGTCVHIPNAVEAMVGEQRLPLLVRAIAVDVLRMMELEGRCLVRFLTNLKHVEIPEGIEKLGKSCFFDKRGILSVKLPASLRVIESRAFRNCINLESVRFLGESIQIEDDAFKNCTSLKTVRTSDGKEYTFAGLNGLMEREVPEMVYKLYQQVMGNFRLSGTILLKYLGLESRVVVPEGVTKIAERAFAGNEAIDRVILPESLEEIGAEAFKDCLLLQTIPFPKELKKIGAGAFDNCVKLIRAHLPEKIQGVEERAFRHCVVLREVSFPDGCTEILESAFYGCESLIKVVFPESLIRIGELAFYRCSGLSEVRIPKRTEEVESLAFAESGVKKVQIESSGIYFGIDVFGGCKRLKRICLGDGVRHLPDKLAYGCIKLGQVMLTEQIQSVGRHAFFGTPFLERWTEDETKQKGRIFWDGQNLSGTVQISENVQIIAGGAFYGNKKVTEVYLPESVRYIGSAAFKGCQKLEKVWIPEKIKGLEAEVFAGCQKLQEIVLVKSGTEEESTELPVWNFIGERAFYQCEKLQHISLEHGNWIGKEAFASCTSLRWGNVKSGLQIGERAFEKTPYHEAQDGLVIIGDVVVSGERCHGEIQIPEGITGIAPYAFAGNREITSVYFPESLIWSGEGAFFGCIRLEKVKISASFERLGARTFERCTALGSVECSMRQAGKAAFANCCSLQRVILPNLPILEERMFENCNNLEKVFCKSVKTIERYCFNGCQNLQDFSFSNVSMIGAYAFAGCDHLKSAEFMEGVCLGAHALEDCSSLEEVVLKGEGRATLLEYALSGCTALQKVIFKGQTWMFHNYQEILFTHIPEIVRLFFHSAFSCFVIEQETQLCGYLGAGRKLQIPQGIQRIEAEVFRDRLMLEEVTIPESVTSIGARAFHSTKWLKKQQKQSPLVVVNGILLDGSLCVGEVVVPEEIHTVSGWAFANGLGIEKIRFLSERTRVEEYAFRNCINLREITLADGTCITFTGIGDRERELPPLAKQAVMECLNCFKTNEDNVLIASTGNISKLRIAYGITAIGERTFEDGNLLTEVSLPETVKSIGNSAFSGCKWLEEVKGAKRVEQIGERAFSCCGVLKRVELSECLQKIGVRTFEHCTSLEEILLPEGIEEIPEKAFYRCHTLRRVQFPSTLKRIGKEAFAFCRELREIQLPAKVIVEERAFFGCPED